MRSLLVRTLAGFLALFGVMALIIFCAAGSLAFWPGWVLIADFAACSGLVTAWLWVHDKALLERRVRAGPADERDPAQRLIQSAASVVFLAI